MGARQNYNTGGDLVSYAGTVIDFVDREWSYEVEDLLDSTTPWQARRSKGEVVNVQSTSGPGQLDANFPQQEILDKYATLKEAQAAHPDAVLTRRAEAAVRDGEK